MNQILNIIIVALLLISTTHSQLCPSFIRVFNSYVTNATAIDMSIDGNYAVQNVYYGTGSKYFSVTPSTYTVLIFVSGTTDIVGNVTFTTAPGTAYTVAVTGITAGPLNEVLFDTSPFVFPTRIFPPNPNAFVGAVFRLDESNIQRNVLISQINADILVPLISPKSYSQYPDQITGRILFSVLTVGNLTVLNNNEELEVTNVTAASGNIIDVFVYGDDSNTTTPVTVTTIITTSTFDPTSGCPLADGSGIITPLAPVFSFSPCSAASLVIGFATLLLPFFSLFF